VGFASAAPQTLQSFVTGARALQPGIISPYGVATLSEDDFEFEPEEPRQQTRGFVVNKSALAKWTGLSPMTVDKLLADGGPIISKGTRKQGWQN
jgi:hypothetical protein